ncbi:MAG: alpha/beta hydrolase [Cyanobacteria bacterium SZAS-4]|nr:alpha/beta hydrolase [Cyanobacteria bacterium SZAS-4]
MQPIIQKLKALNWRFVIKGVIIVIMAIPVIVFLGMAPLINRPLYNWIVFHPAKFPIGNDWNQKACGITPEDIYFKSDNGNMLHGLLYKLPGAKKIALISHGNAGNCLQRAFLAERPLSNGCSVFAYDYSGYGRSKGEPSMEGLTQDGSAAYNYLLSQNYKPEQIVLFGESIGTLVTGELARTHKSAAVILECPLYSLRARGCKIFPYLNIYPQWLWLAPGTNYNNATAFDKEHPPLLLIAGTADHLTPIEQSDQLFAEVSQPKQLIRIDGASHGDAVMMGSPLYKEGLAEFMKNLN